MLTYVFCPTTLTHVSIFVYSAAVQQATFYKQHEVMINQGLPLC